MTWPARIALIALLAVTGALVAFAPSAMAAQGEPPPDNPPQAEPRTGPAPAPANEGISNSQWATILLAVAGLLGVALVAVRMRHRDGKPRSEPSTKAPAAPEEVDPDELEWEMRDQSIGPPADEDR